MPPTVPPRPRRPFRPLVEALEDRRLLATYTVTTGADLGVGSLRAAVALANADPGSTIVFDPAATAVTLTSGQLLLTANVTIVGPAGGVTVARSTAAGTPAFRLFEVSRGVTAEFRDLTLTGGQVAEGGGAVSNRGTLTVEGGTLRDNAAGWGGAVSNEGTLTVTGSTFSGNTATFGGALYTDHAPLTVSASTFRGNSATASGGGILSNYGGLSVTGSTFTGNSAGHRGGAVSYESDGTGFLTSSTLSGNTAGNWGGGLYVEYGHAAVTASTLAGNAAAEGGGVYLNGGSNASAGLSNTLVAGSTRGGDLVLAGGAPLGGSSNFIGDGSGGLADSLTGDPRLGPLADNGGPTWTHALRPGSRAINAGAAFGLTTDQRGTGFPRTVGAHTDVGAFELQTALALTGLVFLDYNANGLADPGDAPRPGAPLFLDTNGNGRRDPAEPATATGPDGRYAFANLGGGLFTVRLDLPPAHGAVPTAPAGGAYAQVAPGPGYDFGLVLVSPVVPLAAAAARFSPAADPDTAYVQGLYHNLLGRAADAGGLAYWVGRLRAGDSPATVAAGLWQSPEHRTWQVQDYYRTYLHREADAAGLAYHVGLFLGGAGEVEVVGAFLGSAEYQAAHATDEAFVRGLYEDVLGRAAGGGEVAGWVQDLAGLGRAEAAWRVAASEESQARMVDGYYAALLQRPADEGGAAAWLAKLRRGATGTAALAPASPAGVAVAFLAAEEYVAAARAAP